MNVVELHERVRFWTDIVQSARFEASDIDHALNTAMNDIVEQKYYSTKKGKGDSFQRTQKIRDELQSLVKVKVFETTAPADILVNFSGYSIIDYSLYPTDYKYLLCISIFKDLTQYNCWPISYDRVNSFPLNPYRRVRLSPFPKAYYNEGSEGIRITHAITSPTKAEYYYLAQAIQWYYGEEYTSTDIFTDLQNFIVTSDTAEYDGVVYKRGTTVEAVDPVLNLTSGTAVVNFVNSDINTNLHEMIARQAAINLMITIQKFDQAKAIIENFE
jgi:hypothetical protein